MTKITCVHAKSVPIVKMTDPEPNMQCDLNVNNHVALKNTKMVRAYMELDSRARPVTMLVKHWTKRRVINEGKLNSVPAHSLPSDAHEHQPQEEL